MGLNAHARLKEAGVPVKKTDVLKLPLSAMVVVTKGPTAHPRAGYPLDEVLKEHIKKHGVPTNERRFKVQEDGDRILVIDGARRTKAGLVAEKELQREAPRTWPLEGPYRDDKDPGRLWVECEVVAVKPLDLILERLAANVSRGLPDTVDVLAASVAQIIAINRGEPDAALVARIVACMPKGVGPAEVAALSRWDDLAVELQGRWVSGEAPIGLLPAVMAARSEDRPALLEKLLAKGVRTAQGATRTVNKAKDAADPWARRMSPRKLAKVAAALTESGAPMANRKISDAARYVAAGMRIAAGVDVESALDGLPAAIVEIIREARAGKEGAR